MDEKQIELVVKLYKNKIEYKNLEEIDNILRCGNAPNCHFDNIQDFYDHYNKFSNAKEKLDETIIQMILDYFTEKGDIKKSSGGKTYSKVNKHTFINLHDEKLIYTVLEIYNKTKLN